jgi:hypothetical protein
LVSFPARRTQISSVSHRVGEDDMLMGASPLPKTELIPTAAVVELELKKPVIGYLWQCPYNGNGSQFIHVLRVIAHMDLLQSKVG